MPKEKDYPEGSIGEQIESLKIEKFERENLKRQITDKMIADFMGMKPPHFSKVKCGEIAPSAYFYEKLAKYFGKSAYELEHGVSEENSHVYKIIPLGNKALTWLNETREDNPDLVKILDCILSDKNMADMLFSNLLLYVKEPALQIKLSNSDEDTIGDETSAEIMKLLVVSSIYKVMEQLKQGWEENKK